MKRLFKIIKLIAVLALIAASLSIVSKQDIEYERQRAQLAGWNVQK